MQDQLKKIIKLIKKTGDKVIVYNENEPDMTFVAMGLDAYEDMVVPYDFEEDSDLTDDGIADKINRDIVDWKNEDFSEEEPDIIDEFVSEKSEDKAQKWKISEDVKEAADEVIEEDRQYLEEISF